MLKIYWTVFHVWYVPGSNVYYIRSEDAVIAFKLPSHPIPFASGYLVKFCNFYPQLNLETVFSAIKLTQICCINMNISFFENWQFNYKLAPTLLLTYQAWKSILTIWQNMKVSGTQKLQFSNSLVNWEKSESRV